MAQSTENIIHNIRKIRRLKQRSIHDCASILNISNEHYLQFEDGNAPLSLPELELLAIYFNIPVRLFFEDKPPDTEPFAVLEEDIRGKYKRLRQKMILAQLEIEIEKENMTLEDLHEATNIPLDALQSYKNGNLSIPVQLLLQIIEALELEENAFYNQDWWPISAAGNTQDQQTHWQPEFPQDDTSPSEQANDPYQDLIRALKKIPKAEQAQIAKILLHKLKSL